MFYFTCFFKCNHKFKACGDRVTLKLNVINFLSLCVMMCDNHQRVTTSNVVFSLQVTFVLKMVAWMHAAAPRSPICGG